MSKIKIIFEIANNHQGSVSHFKNILEDIYNSTTIYKDQFEFFVKFQFRDIPNFIDQTIDPNSNKHISRFQETTLTLQEWETIFQLVRNKGFKIMVTPFDEISVKKALALNVDELKIASCSSTEWSLLQEVVMTNKYVTISTGGRNLREIDDIYSYYQQRLIEINAVDFGDILLHSYNILSNNLDIQKSYQNSKFNRDQLKEVLKRYKNYYEINLF